MTSNVGLQLKAFFYAGIVIPVTLHVLASKRMPWWPDTVSMGIVFGLTAALCVSRMRADWERNRRLFNALKDVVGRNNNG